MVERFEITYDPDLGMIHRPHDHGYYVRHSDYAALQAENARLRRLNSDLMGDDEDKPRYTLKRLKQEIALGVKAALSSRPAPQDEALKAENERRW